MFTAFRHLAAWFFVLFPGLLVGCTGEDSIPEEVLNSPPARRSAPPTVDVYYPQPGAKVAGDERPLYQLTVDRPDESWTLEQTAAESLASLGPAAVPALASQLAASNVAERRQAAEILARVGTAAARTENLSAVTAIVERVEDQQEDPMVRKACARAIGQIGPALAAARAPSPPMVQPALAPLPALTAVQLADPAAVAARQREQARRDWQAERAGREAQRYAARLQDYRLRQQLAQRAAAALLRIAEQGAGEELAARD